VRPQAMQMRRKQLLSGMSILKPYL
jgi:hypothetical protein